MTQLVIGLGEVGSALRAILKCDGYDPIGATEHPRGKKYDVLHIAFPYSDGFEFSVDEYATLLKANLVIVHSSVPVGTCDPHDWVHSPIRGIHPHLEQGIRTFTKFFGGGMAHVAAGIFRDLGIKTLTTPEARETEAMKLWDTTIYGWNILLEKMIKEYCDEQELDFGLVYTLANQTYNEGYEKLGHPEYSKYILKDKPGPIGGHCVQENWELLDSPITAISKEMHKQITDS